jgi:hypothetical protein
MRSELDVVVVDLITAKREKYSLEAQILVYYPTISKTKRLRELFVCTAYYREIVIDKEKAYIVWAFTTSAEKLYIVINILGLRLHTIRVQVVIYVAMCFSIL